MIFTMAAMGVAAETDQMDMLKVQLFAREQFTKIKVIIATFKQVGER
jgi:hypothetical protein